jgi:hypothetical protein
VIEKQMKLTDKEAKLTSYLFGGNKGYEWMTSFLGLLQSISFNKYAPAKRDLIMT